MAINEVEVELEGQLKEAGSKLLNPPSSVNELLPMLDNVGHLLMNVEQAPSRSMQDALLLPMKALISTALLRHADADVKLSVTSCISEIIRITAPDAPYNDDQMKEIFHLTVAAFEKLSHVSGRSYVKAISILQSVAKVRSCLVMLDLELDELIIVMFQHFLKFIRSNHPHNVTLAMETIMTLIIIESEDVSVDMLAPLLASVRKQNQRVSPMAWKLGEKVMTNCAAKLKPYLKEAVQSLGIAVDEYAPIVGSICQDEALKHDHVSDPKENLMNNKRLSRDVALPGEVFLQGDATTKSATSNRNVLARIAGSVMSNKPSKILERCSLIESSDAQGNAENEVRSEKEEETVPKKRDWKPNVLMKPEEGYYHSWNWPERKSGKSRRKTKSDEKELDDSSMENLVFEKVSTPRNGNVSEPVGFASKTVLLLRSSSLSAKESLPSGSKTKRGRPRKKESIVSEDGDTSPPSIAKRELLRSHVEEKVPLSGDASLMKQSKERSKSEAKQPKPPRKIGSANKTAKEASSDFGKAAFQKKTSVLSGREEVPSRISVGVGYSSKGTGSSSVEEIRKRSSGSGSPDEDLAEASDDKKTNPPNDVMYLEEIPKQKHKRKRKPSNDVMSLEEIPKPKHKRKRTPSKELALENPDVDKNLIGSRIKVWWPMDKRFYEGVVHSYDPIKKRHKVCYDDGDEENLNLKKQRWVLIEDDTSPGKQVEKTDLPTSSDVLPKEKGTANSESHKKLRIASSLRSGAESTPRIRARKSSGKSASVGMPDKPNAIDKMDHISKPDGGLDKKGGDFCEIKREQSPPANTTPYEAGNQIVGGNDKPAKEACKLHGEGESRGTGGASSSA